MRIDIFLSSPVSLTTPIMLDSLLALCWHIDNERFEAPVRDDEYVQEELPIEKENGIWKTSAGFIVGMRKKDTWHRRFTFEYDYMIDFGKKMKAIRTGMGEHKAYSMPIVYIPTQKITFFADGDLKETERLLQHLAGIGKKHAIGFGMVKKVEISGGYEDKSFTYNNHAMRSLPCSDYQLDSQRQMLACKMPYYDSKNFELCYLPKWLFKSVEEFKEYTGESYE